MVEEWKWRGVPVWEHDGIICTGETYKAVVKMTFAKGASLDDPSGLFNSSLEGNTRRAIDFHEGDKIDEKALKALIRAAAELNMSAQAARPEEEERLRRRRRRTRGGKITARDVKSYVAFADCSSYNATQSRWALWRLAETCLAERPGKLRLIALT